MFLTSTPKKAVLSRTNSIQCLFCAEFLETSDRIAVFGRFARNSARYLGGELQTSNEDLQYCRRKCYPKLKKIEKNDVKSQKSRRRVESRKKNAVVRIKPGIESRSNSEGICREIAGSEAAEEALFPTNPPQDQTRFPSPLPAKDYLLQATGLPPTVSMVGYTAERHSGVPVFVRAFPACVNIGKNFFSPVPDKLGAANRETASKSNLDEEPFVQV